MQGYRAPSFLGLTAQTSCLKDENGEKGKQFHQVRERISFRERERLAGFFFRYCTQNHGKNWPPSEPEILRHSDQVR